MATLTQQQRQNLLAELKLKFKPCYRLKAEDLDNLIDIIDCLNTEGNSGAGGGDGNDFLQSLALNTGILTAAVNNQVNPTIDLSPLTANLLRSVVAGSNITIDNTDPLNPIINSVGGEGADDQTASEVTFTPTGNTTSTTVQDAIVELQNDIDSGSTEGEVNVQADWNEVNTGSDSFVLNKPTNLSNFTNDVGFITSESDDQVASEVPFTATGNTTSTDVQAAIVEIQTEIDSLGEGVESVIAGNNIIVDNTDPSNPIVSTTFTGGSIDPSLIQAFDSELQASIALGANEFFKFTTTNTDGVVSPNNSVVGITSGNTPIGGLAGIGVDSINNTPIGNNLG